MKKLIILLFLSPLFVAAQTTHTVQPKETLYSLGREYNVHPKELAQYNNIPFDKGLVPGQIIKIPAAGKLPVFVNPAGTTTAKAKEETSVKAAPVKTQTIVKTETVPVSDVAGMTPVYHKVEKKETLYHISTLYNKVSIEDLKKWNHLTNDALAEGEDLIVGYTKAAKNTETVVTKQRYVEPTGKDIPKRNPPALPVVDVPNNNVVKTVTPKNGESETNFGAGFFKSFYSEQAAQKKEEKGEAGIFKSTSGWQDGKYYCLHNSAPIGSIVKITNTTNNKIIYAKVLDVIPDIKQNNGVVVRLSNAAADVLGAGTDNFECVINY